MSMLSVHTAMQDIKVIGCGFRDGTAPFVIRERAGKHEQGTI